MLLISHLYQSVTGLYLAILMIACAGHPSPPGTDTAAKPPDTKSSLADKVFAIADALPLPADSAEAFLTGLFPASDSMHVVKDNIFKRITGKTCVVSIADTGNARILRVVIKSSGNGMLALPMKEMTAKMDSAWRSRPSGPFPVENAPPTPVSASYTDKQQRKKRISVAGPDETSTKESKEVPALTIYISVPGNPALDKYEP